MQNNFWNEVDKNYKDLIYKVFTKGKIKEDRTGTGTRSLFNENITIDLRNSDFKEIKENVFEAYFPMLTSKKMFFKNLPAELCWIWNGLTNTDYLHKYNCKIWDEWADENGELGPVYGYQLRHFGGTSGINNGMGIDQLKNIIELLKNNPSSRRIMASYWNPIDLPNMRLEPCHYGFQCEVHKENNIEYLNLKFNMRSVDSFLGMPQDILLYATILYLLCAECNLKPGYLIGTFGDTHLYANHMGVARDYLFDENFEKIHSCPKIKIDLNFYSQADNENKIRRNILTDLEPECITLSTEYISNPFLKAPIAI